MRKPKVWGMLVGGTDRVLVCATSQRAAVELLERAGFYVTLNGFRNYACETGNAADHRLATEPGVWQELASGWRRVL